MEGFLQLRLVHIRITTNKEFSVIEDAIKDLGTTYLISQEDPGVHQHYHIMLHYQDDDKKHSKLRYRLKKKGVIGDGNGSYSIQLVRNERQLIKYILKDDGIYKYKNIPESVIELLKKCSFKKDPKKFKYESELIDEMFLGREISLKEYERKYILLKVKYGQRLYTSHLKAYFGMMQLKRDPQSIDQYLLDNNF